MLLTISEHSRINDRTFRVDKWSEHKLELRYFWPNRQIFFTFPFIYFFWKCSVVKWRFNVDRWRKRFCPVHVEVCFGTIWIHLICLLPKLLVSFRVSTDSQMLKARKDRGNTQTKAKDIARCKIWLKKHKKVAKVFLPVNKPKNISVGSFSQNSSLEDRLKLRTLW